MLSRRSFFKVALVSAAALSTMGLPSCGESEEQIKKKYIGIWRVSSVVMDGKEVEQSSVDALEEAGNYTLLGIDANGNWASATGNTLIGGDWKLEKNKAILSSSNGEAYELEIKDGKVTMNISGIAFTFEKDTEEIMGQSDYVGEWEIADWTKSGAPNFYPLTFNSDGTCGIVGNKNKAFSFEGTYRVDSGICTYNMKQPKSTGKIQGSFAGRKFIVKDLTGYTFQKKQ